VQTDATLLANNSQHCCILHVAFVFTSCCMLSSVVGSCCVRFETCQTFNYLQTDATSPNIIGPTMLGVVAFVLAVVRKRCNNSEQCWELLRPFARSFRLFRTERQYSFPGVAWAAGVKQNIKKRKYSKKTASSELKSLFAVCFDIVWLYSSDQIEPRSD